jgi:predicted metal-dependent phosphoesterase TrpH
MRIKGALHVHSTLSNDGTLTFAELAAWYRPRGYQFVAIGEHSQDMDAAKVEILKKQCAENSGAQFCMIPGIEFSCQGGLHIFGVGATELTAQMDPVAVAEAIHTQGGFVILAHPQRYQWKCSPEVLLAVDAVEIWNVCYDGKYLPSFQAPRKFRTMQKVNPALLGVAGHDFHRRPSFYDVGIEMDAEALSREDLLARLRQGAYRIRSRFFRAEPQLQFSWTQAACFQLLGRQLAALRKARNLLLRVTS